MGEWKDKDIDDIDEFLTPIDHADPPKAHLYGQLELPFYESGEGRAKDSKSLEPGSTPCWFAKFFSIFKKV